MEIYTVILMTFVGFSQVIQGVPYNNNPHEWRPANGTDRDTWMKCHGLQCSQWSRIKEKMRKIGALQIATGLVPASAAAREPNSGRLPPEIAIDEDLDAVDGCIKLTEDQADEMISGFEAYLSYMGKRRKRRKIFNFLKITFRKWNSMPIKYKFDGRHSQKEKNMIRSALHHWEANTCVRFQEIPTDLFLGKESHLLFTREGTGCHSFIGRIPVAPQQLNLQYTCLWEFGIPVHEIGHALGFWHEHQRWDRDTAIKVLWDNVGYYSSQYYKQPTESLGVPYDIGSVMHYAPKDGSVNTGNVMEALDPLYQSTMGQKTGLSYMDIKLMNAAYCSGACGTVPAPPCERKGYQNPNNCSFCTCPDGFGGRLCETAGPPKKAKCGGTLYASGITKEITSPDYPRPYEDFVECNWIIKAPPKQKIVLKFKDKFGVFCYKQNQCHHWVEVKYRRDKAYPGPRFCCFDTPTTVLESDDNEMVIVLRANWTTFWTTQRKGFRAEFKAINEDGSPVVGPYPIPVTQSTPPQKSTSAYKTTRDPPSLSSTLGLRTRPSQPAPTPLPPRTRPPLTPPPIPPQTPSPLTDAPVTRPPPLTPAPPPYEGGATRRPECPKLDLAFLLDSSGSIGYDNWYFMRDLVYKVSQQFIISDQDIQVGVITFGNEATLHIKLNQNKNFNDLTRDVDRIAWMDQWTNTSGAIRMMRTDLFSLKEGDRYDAPNYGILVTDGQSNRDSHLTLAEADKALASGIKLLVVGIGDQVDRFEMAGIALGSSNSHALVDNKTPPNIISVKDFKELLRPDTIQQIKSFICQEVKQELKRLKPTPPNINTQDEKEDKLQESWSWTCSFESQLDPYCGIQQDNGDDFDFTRWTRATPSELTGPEAAHYGNYYIYIEASNPRRNGDRATVRLPNFGREGAHCLQFAYHMYGFHIRTLEVFIQRNPQTDYVWRKTGEQRNEWLLASQTIYLQKDDMVGFNALRGDEYSGDIGIDDITLSSGSC